MKTLLERIVVNFLAKPKELPVAPKKTLLEQITEEFLVEDDSPATQQAKQMGLVYKQFGRWGDPKTNKITHKSVDGGAKLVPWTDDEDEKEKGDEKEPEDTRGDDAEKDEPVIDQVAQDVTQAVPEDEWGENDELLGDIRLGMEQIGVERWEGVAGAGGAVPSFGEYLGGRRANEMTSNGGFVEDLNQTREADAGSFDARVDMISEHGIAPPNWPFGKPWPGDAHHATKAAGISRRDALGSALFGKGYD